MRAGVILAITILCLMAVVEISSPGKDIGVRPIAVVAVLYILGTVLLPLLRQVSTGPQQLTQDHFGVVARGLGDRAAEDPFRLRVGGTDAVALDQLA